MSAKRLRTRSPGRVLSLREAGQRSTRLEIICRRTCSSTAAGNRRSSGVNQSDGLRHLSRRGHGAASNRRETSPLSTGLSDRVVRQGCQWLSHSTTSLRFGVIDSTPVCHSPDAPRRDFPPAQSRVFTSPVPLASLPSLTRTLLSLPCLLPLPSLYIDIL